MKPEVLERIRAMKRASQVARAGAWRAADAIDRVVLDADERHRRRIVLMAEGGTAFLLDLADVTALRDGDGLVLDDGSVVVVTGQVEPLVEVSIKAGADFVRLAWHIGNRHTDVQFMPEGFRIRRDHVLEEMLRGLGARVTPLEAPFDPEPAPPHGGAHHHDHGE
jgi:urease accessory protein